MVSLDPGGVVDVENIVFYCTWAGGRLADRCAVASFLNSLVWMNRHPASLKQEVLFVQLINQTPKLIHEGFQAQASPALGLLLMQDWGFRGRIKVAGLCLILLP